MKGSVVFSFLMMYLEFNYLFHALKLCQLLRFDQIAYDIHQNFTRNLVAGYPLHPLGFLQLLVLLFADFEIEGIIP